MKKFRFSLNALLGLRSAEEESAQKAYACALQTAEEAALTLAAVERQLRDRWQDLRRDLAAGVGSAHLRHARAWCCGLEEKQAELTAALQQCQRTVDACFEALQLATRRREGLDRLQARQRSIHNQHVLAEDQRSLDEVALRTARNVAGISPSP